MSNSSGSISQSNSGSISGGMQAAIGDYNKQAMSTTRSSTSNILTHSEVIEILTQIENIIRCSGLPEVTISKTTKYIEAAKIEAEEPEPDKQLISRNLERVTKNLEEVDKTLDISDKIFRKIIPLIIKISGWLGMAIGSL